MDQLTPYYQDIDAAAAEKRLMSVPGVGPVAAKGLYPFQQADAEWLAERKVGVLAHDMGLGKSAMAITAAGLVGARSILVICPAIARDMWQREVEVWQQRPRSIQVVRSGADAQRLWGDVVVVSYSLADKIKGRFDLLIIDEAQALKSIDAVRTKSIYGRNGLIGRVKRVWLLSGTLSPNHPGELWTHYRVLFSGSLTYWQFVERFCIIKKTNFGQQITGANLARTAELADILRPYILQRQQRDVLPELPPMRWAHMPLSPAKVPPQPDLPIEIEAILGKLERGQSLSMVDQMHLSTLRRWTGVAKAPAVVELIQAELEGVEKIVCFAVHREVIQTIATGLGPIAAVINGDTAQSVRQGLIDAFQTQDRPRVLILQITVAGTALTLHRSNRVIFAEQTWVPADVVQAAKRCHRIGQKNSVLATLVSLAGSIDERVNGVVMRKSRELAELENLISKGTAA